MSDLSIFVDEAGTTGASDLVVSLVFHDQGEDIHGTVGTYERALAQRGLPDIPFHASALMHGHDDYDSLGFETRKRLFFSFLDLYKRFPIAYAAFTFLRHGHEDVPSMVVRMRRELVNFFFDNLEFFQSFDHVKVYYDNGQAAITSALKGALEYALCRDAVIYRAGNPREHRLAQIADLVCAVEFAELKYRRNDQTATYEKLFGPRRAFRKNTLSKVRTKLLP